MNSNHAVKVETLDTNNGCFGAGSEESNQIHAIDLMTKPDNNHRL
ncbi:hypothetical protein D024_1322 [Vibrio parahaemolyticus 3259]|nr:hypothetical protein D024_1322 [Vibrio parahaemolyticus 3259]ETJ85785.1 hypothetical protein D041_4266 [Vibrio parahaemolyticus EKP-008]